MVTTAWSGCVSLYRSHPREGDGATGSVTIPSLTASVGSVRLAAADSATPSCPKLAATVVSWPSPRIGGGGGSAASPAPPPTLVVTSPHPTPASSGGPPCSKSRCSCA